MVVLGIDVHKHTHTTVAVDQVGRQLGQRTVRTNDEGCTQLLGWARATWRSDRNQRLWAIEDCRHVSGRLERVLLAAGERVVRVPPKLTVVHRRATRTRGKSDPSTRSRWPAPRWPTRPARGRPRPRLPRAEAAHRPP
jgi:transposase